MIIENGVGNANKAKVDSNNRLHTLSVAQDNVYDAATNRGDAYDFSTADFVAITNADTESGILYLSNDSTTRDLHIHTVRTCAEAAHKVKIYRNVTGGTLVSTATAGIKTNINFGSSKTPDATVYSGADSATITGTVMTQHINGVGHSTLMLDGALVLGPGDTIAISMELSAAGDCCVRMVGYYQ